MASKERDDAGPSPDRERQRRAHRPVHANDRQSVDVAGLVAANPDPATIAPLQRLAGNRAVTAFIDRSRRPPDAPITLQRHVSDEQIAKIRVDTSKVAKRDITAIGKDRTMQTVDVTEGSSSVKVEYEVGNRTIFEQLEALRAAIRMVATRGFRLPPGITVHFATASSPGVMTQAYEVIDEEPSGEAPKLTREMVVMPNYSTAVTAREGSEEQFGITGGVGSGGRGRGVADAEADKARSAAWFWEKSTKAKRAMATAVIVHELGHILHTTMDPQRFYDAKKNPTDYRITSVAPSVSEYAMSSPVEFAAEVFTGLVHGRVYSAEVMAKYAELGGPTPPRAEAAEHADHDPGTLEVIPAAERK